MYHVGRELGICEEFNLCAGTREDVTDYCRLLLRQVKSNNSKAILTTSFSGNSTQIFIC